MAGVRGAGRKAWDAMMKEEGVSVANARGSSKRKRSSGRPCFLCNVALSWLTWRAVRVRACAQPE